MNISRVGAEWEEGVLALAAERAAELRALANRVPPGGSPAVAAARQRAQDAAATIQAALAADPTLSERAQRDLDVLAELLRRLTPLARQAANAAEAQRLIANGESAGHLGRINSQAPDELDAVSQRCTEIAGRITAAVRPDWNSPHRTRELSARRMPGDG